MTKPHGNPQLEDGHTRIAHELLEAILRYPFTGGELKVILAVIRLTYGWHVTERSIRQRDLARLTGLAPRYLHRVLTSLRQQGVLFRQRYSRPHVYALNKHYYGWKHAPQDVLGDTLDAGRSAGLPNLSARSGQPDPEVSVAPDPWVRTYKDRKINSKDSAPDPTVHNLLERFAQIMGRALTPQESDLITRLQDLSPSQAQRLLEQVTERINQSHGGVDGNSATHSPEPTIL